MFRNRVKEEAEEEHDYLCDSTQVTKNVQDTVNVPYMPYALSLKSHEANKVIVVIILLTELLAVEGRAYLVE